MPIIQNNIRIPTNITQTSGEKKTTAQTSRQSFQEILSRKMDGKEEILFSKHAEARLRMRDINFSQNQLKRIEEGVTKAEQKGIKDSLVLVDDVALLVNIKNKMVITAMSGDNENVFTNIDGAVIV